ncbi:DUF4132 domain-containing protein [Gilliamella apicola]|uniref:DUF4132 domain-containing protein n=1 Tax=Gilliamella apicola TaxID=1196095 RepID=UPI002740A720|nr:DUF4132 domain-containing protein [Gilliamella apicola]WLS92757.1 DUF4132 domain-containing protein [Gilliamella apicola]
MIIGSIEQLHQLLEIEQIGLGDQLMFALFERQQIPRYYYEYFNNVYAIRGLKLYITENLEWFKSLPDQELSEIGQLQQLQYIASHDELKELVVELLVKQSVCSNKKIRELATTLLLSMPKESAQNQLIASFQQGTPKQRCQKIALLVKLSVDKGILEKILTEETNKIVVKSIENALFSINNDKLAKQQEDEFIIPHFMPITEVDLPVKARDILQQNYQELLIQSQNRAQQEKLYNQRYHYRYKNEQERCEQLTTFTDNDLDMIFRYLNGKGQLMQSDIKNKLTNEIILHKGRLQALPEFNLYHLLRAERIIHNKIEWFGLALSSLKHEILLHTDLRLVAQVLNDISDMPDVKRIVAAAYLMNYYYDLTLESDANCVWPFFAENLIYLDEALGLIPSLEPQNSGYTFDKKRGLKILTFFPKLPAKYNIHLLELALGDTKIPRLLAQQALSKSSCIHRQVEKALTSNKFKQRILAANLLVILGNKSSIAALNTALNQEKQEAVQAALLSALESLGENIGQYLTPSRLLNDAIKGLKSKKPTGIEWLVSDTIPALTWQNGDQVDRRIITWWTWLAVKLKEPSNPLLTIYTRLLSEKSQQQLGLFILQSFIQQDTLTPTLAEAEYQANIAAPQRLKDYKNCYKTHPDLYPEYQNITLEQVIESIKLEIQTCLMGSAIKSKGLLALIGGMEGHIAVSIIKTYMKNHYIRRGQIEAMLEAISVNDNFITIQFLLSIAHRYSTKVTQEKAKSLVNQIAERQKWTTDELADRTIVTAGLDDSGKLVLDYGARIFTASIDDNFKWQLKNSEGNNIKTLPEGRKDEDPTVIKEVKKQFSHYKKELAQIVTIQTERLYEAMCTQRRWQVSNWQQYLFAHPIVGRLVQRLVWLAVDEQGKICNSFRPTEDGSLINLNDEEIILNQNHYITLAHNVLLPASHTKQWQEHLKDYKVTPMFDQFANSLPKSQWIDDGIVNNYKGWLTDSITIRNILTKRGYKPDYQSDFIEENDCVDCYSKYYSNINLYANIQFSGYHISEENISVEYYVLSFSRKKGNRKSKVDANHILPILLAESFADYMAVANVSSKFDSD